MTSNMPNLGVIEGFYGKSWPEQSRLQMARWLPQLGIDSYLYAPKSDSALRKAWRQSWSETEFDRLETLAATCAESGLALYIGLSPYALYEAYEAAERRALMDRVSTIVDLGVTGLALLFDDMPGGQKDLAARQLEIIGDVHGALQGRRLIVCPTYYSDDEVLDRVFGNRPHAYVEDFCNGLHESVGVFWTGPQVCSSEISAEHLKKMTERCGPRIYLWDNYPVNDSKLRSEHLYVEPLSGRVAEAGQWLQGHWCNAMNQPALSLSALASLPALYGRQPLNQSATLRKAGIAGALREACRPLAAHRKEQLSDVEILALETVAQGDSMAAAELTAWLAGEYTFDPACLTD